MKDFVIKLMHRQTLLEIEVIVSARTKADAEQTARQFQLTHSIVSIRERK
jgi:hypothetical protein